MTEHNKEVKAELDKGYWHYVKTASLKNCELEHLDRFLDYGGEWLIGFKNLGMSLAHLIMIPIVLVFWLPLLYVSRRSDYKDIADHDRRVEESMDRMFGKPK
jgi:hypothetical protein